LERVDRDQQLCPLQLTSGVHGPSFDSMPLLPAYLRLLLFNVQHYGEASDFSRGLVKIGFG